MKKIIIIGAGIAGLSTGVFALQNGFEVEIFEMHSKPGGECTGWNRGDYHFDNCIHWLMGSKKGLPLHKLWEAAGALDDSIDIVNNEIFISYESGNKRINFYRNLDRLEKHLLEEAPEDRDAIIRFCRDAKKFIKLEMPIEKPFDMFTKGDIAKMVLKMLPIAGTMQKYEKISMSELAEGFKNQDLKKAITSMIPSHYKASALLSTLASLHNMDSGWPAGGSLALAERIEARFTGLGGKVNYKAKVKEIIIEDGSAKGIMLADGSSHYGDYVIGAADGYEIIYGLLKGKYVDETIKTLFTDTASYPTHTSVNIFLGVDADLSAHPHSLYYKLKKPIDTGGMSHEYMTAKHYCYEPAFAPKGNSAVTIFFEADYDWWEKKKTDPEAYKAEKERILAEAIAAFIERFPEAEGKIKNTDMATPMTYVRYCSAYRGSWMSWAPTPGAKIRFITGILPGLDNFYLTGQWTMPPGGLPTAVMSGKWTIQRICKRENITFKN